MKSTFAVPDSSAPIQRRLARHHVAGPGRLCAALVLAVAAAGCTTVTTNPSNAIPDSAFVRGAATSGQNEIQASKVAQDKTGDPAVRAFAMQMIQDHTTANAQLSTILQPKGVSVSDGPDAEHVAAIAKLSAMTGPAFDRAYLQQMVVDHQKTIALFDTESRTGGDVDVKSFATMTLPILQHHLQMAQQLANR